MIHERKQYFGLIAGADSALPRLAIPSNPPNNINM
jgi:hypothetical protein